MEKRFCERIPCHLNARIVFQEKNYYGFIENVSESGIGYLITSSVRVKDELDVYASVELNFQISPVSSVNLNGEVIWTKRGLFSGKTIGVGISIIDPPPEYREWIKSLLLNAPLE